MKLLKQSTSVTILIGPFVDDSDGNAAETGLTIAQADVRLSKNGSNMAQKNEATSCTHDELGYYTCPLDTTDTGTLGILKVMVHESGALPVWDDYMVVTANVWDTLCSTEKFDVNVAEVSNDGTAADDLELLVENSKGTDNKVLVSTDAQDLSGTLDVNTKTITAGIIANASFNADVGSTAYGSNVIALAGRKLMDELNLDHLMKVATGGADMTTEIADNSALSRLLANGDTSAFDPAAHAITVIEGLVGDVESRLTAARAGYLDALNGHTAQTGDSYAIVNSGSYGNAQLVRSTTPANALDVSATGEAGLDFDNIKDASGAHTLTNITVPTVTTLTGHTAQTGDGYAIVNSGTYGNAQLVRSTTPANALDVSATGEAGLDFANIKDATGAHTLTNITVPTVTTLTGHTGQTGDTYAQLPTNFSSLGIESDGDVTKVNSLDGHTVQTGDSFARIGAAGASLTDLGGMSSGMKIEVNDELKDVMATDTHAQPAQGAPPATTSYDYMLRLMYKFTVNRNLSNSDDGEITVFASDAVTADHQAAYSDDGTEFDRGEYGTGA